MRTRLAPLLLAASALIPAAAAAADLPSRVPAMVAAPPPSNVYIVTVSGDVQMIPSFPGSDRYTGVFYPSLSWRRAGEPERFTAPDDGISITAFETANLRIGPVARIETGRFLQDDRRLYGLHKVPFDVELGAFLEYWPVDFLRARVELRHGVRDDIGFVGSAGIDFVQRYGRFTFSLGPRLNFADTDYVNTYFGVSPAEAAINGRVFAYRPQGGVTSVGGLGSVTYKWNETWATTGYVGYNRLVGDVADSPIVTRIGSRDQLLVGAGVSYSFNFTPSW
jgi:outer membrane scaffolding protein for murein synthesis (MipA/OmpV family)